MRNRSSCHQKGRKTDRSPSLDWDLLSGIILPSELVDFLEGRLKHNVVEMPLLHNHVTQVPYFDYAGMLRKMFDAMRDEGDDDDNDEWKPQEWLCTDCVKAFIKLNLRTWWLRYKQERQLIFLKLSSSSSNLTSVCRWSLGFHAGLLVRHYISLFCSRNLIAIYFASGMATTAALKPTGENTLPGSTCVTPSSYPHRL